MSNTPPSTPFVVKAEADRLEETTILFGQSPNHIKIAAADTGGRLAMFEYIGRTRGGPPMHAHAGQDEIYFVREGDYLFQVGGQSHRLGPGDTIFLPRGAPHAFSQLSAEGRMLFMFTPAGDMEAFFRDQAKLTAPPQPAEAADMFAQRGMVLVGPPLPMT
jgi:quercetin dioxygenase-like cupin family protein